MSKRHFSLAAIAILLLSPNLVSANEPNEGTNLSVGNIQITTTDNGTSIKTPKIQIDTPKSTENRTLISRTRQRSRTQIRRKRTSAPVIIRQRVDPDDNEPRVVRPSTIRTPKMPSVPSVPSVPTSTIRTTPTVRTSTVRTTSEDGDSRSVSEQSQSIQCSGSGSSVSQSSSTVNGRTVNSEVRSNCQ